MENKFNISQEILNKHQTALTAARNYWVLNLPTMLSDREFDELERNAREDGLELRDYVYQEIQGTRTPNAPYITKVPKTQVEGSMLDAVIEFTNKYRLDTGEDLFWIPKYDGSSLAGYYDTNTGECIRVVTIGGSNLGGDGIDQTWKFAKYFPKLPNTGICAIQAECLVSLESGFGESSRQKANGLVNSKYLEDEVDLFAEIRAFRFFLDINCPWSELTCNQTYEMIINSLPKSFGSTGGCKFSGGEVYTIERLKYLEEKVVNKDIWYTNTGTFLVDGLVAYTTRGECVQALKYKNAGRGETTEVLGIKWNNQLSKGKDSWSANALIKPVMLRGSKCTKPSVGSIKKMVQTGLSKGARVTVILANSTIPQVSDVLDKGNLDYEWPTCSCGHKMGVDDIFGALLKCGNPNCTEREDRMSNYLATCSSIKDINLNKLLIIDRFKWEEKSDLNIVIPGIENIIINDLGSNALFDLLSGFLTTTLQTRNLKLVINPAYNSLRKFITG